MASSSSSMAISRPDLDRLRALREDFVNATRHGRNARALRMPESLNQPALEDGTATAAPVIKVRTNVHLHSGMAEQIHVTDRTDAYTAQVAALQQHLDGARGTLDPQQFYRYRLGLWNKLHEAYQLAPNAPAVDTSMLVDRRDPRRLVQQPAFSRRNMLDELNKMIKHIDDERKSFLQKYETENAILRDDGLKAEHHRDISLEFRQTLVQRYYKSYAAWENKLAEYLAARDALFGFGKTDDPWHIHQAVLAGERLATLLRRTRPAARTEHPSATYLAAVAELEQAKDYFEVTMKTLHEHDADVAQLVAQYFDEDDDMRAYLPTWRAGVAIKASARASSATPPHDMALV